LYTHLQRLFNSYEPSLQAEKTENSCRFRGTHQESPPICTEQLRIAYKVTTLASSNETPNRTKLQNSESDKVSKTPNWTKLRNSESDKASKLRIGQSFKTPNRTKFQKLRIGQSFETPNRTKLRNSESDKASKLRIGQSFETPNQTASKLRIEQNSKLDRARNSESNNLILRSWSRKDQRELATER
jgi:hypothetical protein